MIKSECGDQLFRSLSGKATSSEDEHKRQLAIDRAGTRSADNIPISAGMLRLLPVMSRYHRGFTDAIIKSLNFVPVNCGDRQCRRLNATLLWTNKPEVFLALTGQRLSKGHSRLVVN